MRHAAASFLVVFAFSTSPLLASHKETTEHRGQSEGGIDCEGIGDITCFDDVIFLQANSARRIGKPHRAQDTGLTDTSQRETREDTDDRKARVATPDAVSAPASLLYMLARRANATAYRTTSQVVTLAHSAQPVTSLPGVDIFLAFAILLVPLGCYVYSMESVRGPDPGCDFRSQMVYRPSQPLVANDRLPSELFQTQYDAAQALREAQFESGNQYQAAAHPPSQPSANVPPPALPGPGEYLIVHDKTTVFSMPRFGSPVVATLPAGMSVLVKEVIQIDGVHVRGRLEKPLGWITLMNLQDGYQWAALRFPGPVVMHCLLDEEKIGIALNQKLVVTELADVRAAQFGWGVGDKVRAVNCVPVSTEDGFLEELRRAKDALILSSRPMVFDIVLAKPGLILVPEISEEGGDDAPRERRACWPNRLAVC